MEEWVIKILTKIINMDKSVLDDINNLDSNQRIKFIKVIINLKSFIDSITPTNNLFKTGLFQVVDLSKFDTNNELVNENEDISNDENKTIADSLANLKKTLEEK